MAIIRFSVSDERYEELKLKADKKGQTIQGYVRSLIFGEEEDIFSPANAYARAIDPKFKATVMSKRAKTFGLRDLYSADEWSLVSRGDAGTLGKKFFEWVQDHPGEIRYLGGGNNGQRAKYEYVGGTGNGKESN